jgi:hypothetical protein
MKKIFNIFMVAAVGALTLQSCDPLDDTYAELDKSGVDNSLVVELNYELLDADYTSLKSVSGFASTNKAFSSEDSAKVLLPTFLSSKYRYEEETSEINVTYNISGVNNKMLPTFVHTLTTEDYIAVNGTATGNPSVPRFTNLNSAASIIKAAEATNKTPLNGAVSKLTFEWNRPVKDSTVTVVYFDGSWTIPTILAAADYTTMGQSNPNFSSIATVNQYLPVFLENKFPYSLTEENVMSVIYALYNSATRVTTTEVALLKYTGGNWAVINGTVKNSSKFVVKDGKWVADNTIKYKLVTDDYKITIAALSLAELPAASANIKQYGNFDMRNWKVDQIEKYLGLFADGKFPNATVGQVCQLTYVTYSPSGTLVKSFVKKDNGKFEVE